MRPQNAPVLLFAWLERIRSLIMRTLSGLGDHVLTAELNGALGRLIDVFNQAGRFETDAKTLRNPAPWADKYPAKSPILDQDTRD